MKFPSGQRSVFLLSAIIFALTSASVSAAVLIVTNTDDSGAGSLRDTIAATSDGDTIQFDPALNGQAIILTTAALEIAKGISIEGPGASQLTVQRSTANGTPAFRIFLIGGTNPVAIAGLTISNGTSDAGGGIVTYARALTLARCVISGNSAANGGGGIYCDGGYSASTAVSINNCTISGNSGANGGGIYVVGPYFYGWHGSRVTITDSTIADNGATSYGGGIFCDGGTFTVVNSTISTNVATADESGGGGGILSSGGTMRLTNSTISGNSASLGGGVRLMDGHFPFNDGPSTITNVTISGNSATAGGGIFTSHAQRSRNTLIALNTSSNGPDVNGEITSEGFNLIGNNSGATVAAQASDLIGTPASPIDALLGPLQNNGGPTFTHALLRGSPAIDQGESSTSTTDQRGFARVVDFPDITNVAGGDGTDIGAYESAFATLANISTRLRVEAGDNAMIGGFIVTGTQPKAVIIRGIGPSLSLTGALADPVIAIYGSSGELLTINDNWRDGTHVNQVASSLPPANDLESAVYEAMEPGAYTVIVQGKNGGTGIGLFEVYDVDQAADSKLANISTRGFVGTGDNVMIGGTIIRGDRPAKVLLRAIGPSLANVGVPNALGDPVLELYDGNGGLVATSYNWRDDQETEIIATGIPPSNDLESAIVRELVPGQYTAIVHGLNNTTGIALVEVYNLN